MHACNFIHEVTSTSWFNKQFMVQLSFLVVTHSKFPTFDNSFLASWVLNAIIVFPWESDFFKLYHDSGKCNPCLPNCSLQIEIMPVWTRLNLTLIPVESLFLWLELQSASRQPLMEMSKNKAHHCILLIVCLLMLVQDICVGTHLLSALSSLWPFPNP